MNDNIIARQARLAANNARLADEYLVADALIEAAEEIERLEREIVGRPETDASVEGKKERHG
jgi:hypothetical protein